MSKNDGWLEQVLSRDLAKVEAPPELSDRVLWDRVPAGAQVRRERVMPPLAWAFGAALLVLALALGVRHESHAAGLGQLKLGQLQSGDPVQVRAWVKSSTGLDVALPDVLGSSVQLLGARVVDPSVPSVEVEYRVHNLGATLLVAKASDAAGTRHADLKTVANRGGKITWIARGQLCTLSCPGAEEERVACLLCHAS